MKDTRGAGWDVEPLARVAAFLGGGTPSKRRKDFWGGDVLWVSPKDMKSDIVTDSQDHITTAAVAGSAAKMIPAGSVLVVVRSGILARTVPTAVAGRDLTINQDLKAIVPGKRLDRRYLGYFMKASEAELLGAVTRGATVHRLTTDVLKNLSVPVPPLEEQRRVVAILDEAFEGLAHARIHAEANLQNASELLETVVDGIFVDSGWDSRDLHDLAHADCSLSYGIVQPGDEVEDGLPVVRPVDLTSKEIGLDGLKRIDPSRAASYGRTTLVGGELLLCVRGTTGTVAIAADELAGANVTRGIVPVRFDPSKIDPRFGYYQFLSKHVQSQIAAATYGAALMQINIRDLKKLKFFAPSLEEQITAMERIEAIAESHGRLDRACRQRLLGLRELRQSLLKRAFAGELT